MKGNYEEAKKELLRAEQMVETPDSVIYDHIARAHYKLGEKEAAIEYMKKAVELDPEKEEFSKRLEEFEKSATAAPEKKDKPAEEAKPEELKPAA